RLVLPWLLPRLPAGAPLHLDELSALRPARTVREWARVALSARIGGTPHLPLDGITHRNEPRWAVALPPWLRTLLPAPLPPMALYDALHAFLSLVLGVAGLLTWQQLARERRLWIWRREEPAETKALPVRDQRQLLAWIVACASGGALVAPL